MGPEAPQGERRDAGGEPWLRAKRQGESNGTRAWAYCKSRHRRHRPWVGNLCFARRDPTMVWNRSQKARDSAELGAEAAQTAAGAAIWAASLITTHTLERNGDDHDQDWIHDDV